MIEYQNLTNELVVLTKNIPQNCGEIVEQITVDNYSSNNKYFLELKCPKNSRFISAEIAFSGNIGSVKLGNIISQNIGKVFVQLAIRDINNKLIGKSLVSTYPLYKVEPSINATRDISKEKVDDILAYLLDSIDNLNVLKRDIEQKLKAGYFNGKDGTIIKINNQVANEINFNENPQVQLDNKVSKQQANVLSICPSFNFINNIYPNVDKWDNLFVDYVAPTNGYIFVRFKTKENVKVNNQLNSFQYINGVAEVMLTTSAMPLGYDNHYQMYLPVTKGLLIRLLIEQYQEVIPESFQSKFIYAEQI